MPSVLEKEQQLLDRPLGWNPRALLVAAALVAVLANFLPLWNLTMFAPQYPDGLRLDIYSFRLEGGNHGQDVREINLLNHYIGMKDLAEEDFTQFRWLPFALGVLALLFLRAAVHGRVAQLLDVVVLFVYFGLYSLWSFGYTLYRYGHDLSPQAAVKVAPFTPPLLGHAKLANFDVYSFPKLGTYAMLLVVLLLAGAVLLALWRGAARVRVPAAEPLR
jgi:copper chaperone NosL